MKKVSHVLIYLKLVAEKNNVISYREVPDQKKTLFNHTSHLTPHQFVSRKVAAHKLKLGK